MASSGIQHRGIAYFLIRKHDNCRLDERSYRILGSTSIFNNVVKLPNHRVSAAVSATVACDSGRRSAFAPPDGGMKLLTKRSGNSDYDEYNDRTSIESPRVSDKLDEWMRNSVTEIVKNIKQVPLLVQIYADGEMETKKASPEEWPDFAKHRSSLPEGVILVDELRENTDLESSDDEFEEDDGSRAFGVLIQGRDECKSRCYLLKTSSVNGGELGHICTHFCLMKVQSFHTSAFTQLNDSWLVH